MATGKKRRVAMGPVRAIKMQLLDWIQTADPEDGQFAAALAEAVVVVSLGGATGPAQAVASAS